jgi:hypothetical protein
MPAIVGTEAAKLSTVQALKPGAEIEVSGDLHPAWSGLKVAEPGITIHAAPGATLSGYPILQNVQGVTLSGFTVKADAPGAAAIVGLGGGTSERVVLEDCEFIGAGATTDGRGAGVIANGITLRRVKVHDFHSGFSIQGATNITIEDAQFRNILMDCTNISDGSNITLRRWDVADMPGSGLHHDIVQCLRGIDGLTIEDLIYVRGSGVSIQGLFLMGGGSNYTNVAIRRIAMFGPAWEGLHLTNMASGIVEDVFIQGDGIASDGQVQTPWAQFDYFKGGIVRNVTAGSISGLPATAENTGNRTIKNAVNGDRSAFTAYVQSLGKAPPAVETPPAAVEAPPTPAPPPQPVPPAPEPAPMPDDRDARISALTAAGLDLVSELKARAAADALRASTAEAALNSVARLAADGAKVTSAAKAKLIFGQIAKAAADQQ